MKHHYLLWAFLFSLTGIFIYLVSEMPVFDIISLSYTLPKMIMYYIGLCCVIVFWILSIYSFNKFMILLNQEKIIQKTDQLELEESYKLIHSLRSQHYDFQTQLNDMKSLAELQKCSEIVKYIQNCNLELSNSHQVVNYISNPAILAMLLFFATEAKEKGILLSIDSDLDFSQFNFSAVRITKVLGNIIRNAIEILEKTDAPDRQIQIIIWETATHYSFKIWNNGPPIPESTQKQIFTPGFSTRNSTGLGLSIVRETLTSIGGGVTVKSDAFTGTEFKINIPKKRDLKVVV